jgi:hypothetical protein
LVHLPLLRLVLLLVLGVHTWNASCACDTSQPVNVPESFDMCRFPGEHHFVKLLIQIPVTKAAPSDHEQQFGFPLRRSLRLRRAPLVSELVKSFATSATPPAFRFIASFGEVHCGFGAACLCATGLH